MSLAFLMLRNLTVLALTNRTLAGPEVQSSALVPINEIGGGGAVPVIAVFTDAAKADHRQIDGADIIGASVEVTLAIEVACFNRSAAKDGSGGDIFIPETDEGMEMTLDIIQRQAIVELQTGETPWARLWRACRLRVCGMNVIRGAASENSVRFAARRIEIELEVVSDPIPGAPLPPFWSDAFAALTGLGGNYARLVPTLQAVATGDPLPPWKQWRNELGLNDDAMTSIGVGPLEGVSDDDGGLIAVTELAGESATTTITVDADQATITDAADPDHPVPLVE